MDEKIEITQAMIEAGAEHMPVGSWGRTREERALEVFLAMCAANRVRVTGDPLEHYLLEVTKLNYGLSADETESQDFG